MRVGIENTTRSSSRAYSPKLVSDASVGQKHAEKQDASASCASAGRGHNAEDQEKQRQ